MSPDEIRTEAREAWLRGFERAGRSSSYDEAFGAFIRAQENESEAEATAHLQPWLHILEDSIQWLANVAAILDERVFSGRCTNVDRSVSALVGASAVHAVAVRRLLLSASTLDAPARAEARTLDEHLCACIAFLHDRSLAEQFQACQSSAETADFWYRTLNTKALKKYLNAVERSFGLDEISSHDMREWRNCEIEAFSQAIHPSYPGAALTAWTRIAGTPDAHSVAFLGRASAASERPLNFACKSIWYFCCVGFMMLLNEHASQRPLIEIDKEDKMHQMAIVGREVLQALNRKYWEYEIYP